MLLEYRIMIASIKLGNKENNKEIVKCNLDIHQISCTNYMKKMDVNCKIVKFFKEYYVMTKLDGVY